MSLFRSATCDGELCRCGAAADHKVEEVVAHDDPSQDRHPLSAYVCRAHFDELMGRGPR